VLLRSDLAILEALVQAVKRSKPQFPDDFLFRLKPDENEHLETQSVTSS
jgi:hypothetical protein